MKDSVKKQTPVVSWLRIVLDRRLALDKCA